MPVGGSISDAKALAEAKKQLMNEGYIVDGMTQEQEASFEEEVANEYVEETDETSAILESVLGKSANSRSVLEEAKLRLELAKIYEMIMRADIFQDLDADPRAVSQVKQEFSDFATERLEILLGMRAEKKQAQQVEPVHYPANDLNEIEVLALKDLAFKLTKGESALAPAPPAVPKQPAKQKGLRPLNQVMSQRLVKHRQQRPQRKPGPMKQIYEMNEDELRERSKMVRSAPKAKPTRQQPLPMPMDGINYAEPGGTNAGSPNFDQNNIAGIIARAMGATAIEDVGGGE